MFRSAMIFFLLLFLLDNFSTTTSEPTWTSLRVTYGVNIFSSINFAKLPRQESKARQQGYSKIPGDCSGGKFLGWRYINGDDPTVIMLYDVNGYVAGLQHGIPKRDVDRVFPGFSYKHSPAYQLDVINDHEVYLLTSYFIDPMTICTSNRTEDDYEEDGTGTGLYFQNGTDPIRSTIHVPLYEEEISEPEISERERETSENEDNSDWVKGECKIGIGVHYWHDYSSYMKCDNFFPFTVVYNRGKITGFAFFNFGYYDFSERFEHPSKSSLDDYMSGPLPRCIEDEYDISNGFSMMHVFFSVRPWNIIC